jgi:hypothetical protein
MSSDRIKGHNRTPVKPVRRADGRYLRFSWRYNAWQIQSPITNDWRSIRPEMARCYAAAGFPIGVQTANHSNQGD